MTLPCDFFLKKMQNVSWGALAVSGCMIVYFVFLGIASYSPSMIPENSYGFYQAIVGNLSEKYQYVENKLTIGEDPWDKCVLPKYDVWDEEVMPVSPSFLYRFKINSFYSQYVNPNKNPLKNCDTSFVPFTALQNSSWKIVNTNKNLECRARYQKCILI